ncbi:endonuclease domain-containing protein [Sphingomonas montanisoli]|uniref:Endonuclease domain-containing protein n=1 Tax=Sphingomonas montanisoli TaxID=2606412 RepID=A0A5D9CB11_9SPHN|nr:endonuclease domain-containing protein [Sphingomonas montanisoli]TZG27245.1 endonuclease domain-containing protein [Sphingomonas montanisoli]
MRLQGSSDAKRNAKRLRQEMTPPELALWQALRSNPEGLRFRKQHAAGDYVLDFYCARAKLAIEVDGEAHDRGDRPARDAVRDAWLGTQGVQVVRYSAQEVLTNLEGVVRHIVMIAIERCGREGVRRRPPPPSPAAPPPPGGGG